MANDQKGRQRTTCEACGNSNLLASDAAWTDDGSSFCPQHFPGAASTPAKTGELVEHSFNACDLDLAPEVLAKALELALDRGGQTLPVSDYDISRAKVIINGENSEIASLREALTASQAEVASLRELIDDLRDAASSFRDESGDEVAGQIITRIDAAIEAGRVK